MVTLRNPQKSIPGGLRFTQPEIRFTANGSIDQITQQLIAARRANSRLAQLRGWSTDYQAVFNEVVAWNARLCERMGWTQYILAEGGQPAPAPFSEPQSPARQLNAPSSVRRVAAGGSAIVEWLRTGAEAVPRSQSEHRASVCAGCPQNDKGKADWTRWFTIPVSNAIKKAFTDKEQMGLQTSFDDILTVCNACLCPLGLMVHVPLALKLKHMDAETKADLDPRCWVLEEEKHGQP